ncbi:hypothetical protein [Streptomyces sp. NPDC001315]|uniref:hypothetical protein n=1 Tax=Streptomyces sp. NPDC001315 TaxID=3364562 RepID=UPI0036A2CD6D
METDAVFWDPFAFDETDDVNGEAVTAVFGTVDIVARGRAAGAACPDAAASRTGPTTAVSAGSMNFRSVGRTSRSY